MQVAYFSTMGYHSNSLIKRIQVLSANCNCKKKTATTALSSSVLRKKKVILESCIVDPLKLSCYPLKLSLMLSIRQAFFFTFFDPYFLK